MWIQQKFCRRVTDTTKLLMSDPVVEASGWPAEPPESQHQQIPADNSQHSNKVLLYNCVPSKENCIIVRYFYYEKVSKNSKCQQLRQLIDFCGIMRTFAVENTIVSYFCIFQGMSQLFKTRTCY